MTQLTRALQSLIHAEPWPQSSFILPSLQVHRGYHIEGLQENTLAAFAKAAELGASMCECDIRLSQDCIPVVVHDQDLKRVANKNIIVNQSTANVLLEEGNIPSLQSVLTSPSVPDFLNIELKTNQISDSLIRHVANVITDCRRQNSVMVSSFNPFALWMMQNYLPDVPRALLVTDQDGEENNFLLKNMVLAPFLKIQMLNLDHRMITIDLLKQFKGKIPISAWTVNDAEKAKELLVQGVQSIISDRILLLG